MILEIDSDKSILININEADALGLKPIFLVLKSPLWFLLVIFQHWLCFWKPRLGFRIRFPRFLIKILDVKISPKKSKKGAKFKLERLLKGRPARRGAAPEATRIRNWEVAATARTTRCRRPDRAKDRRKTGRRRPKTWRTRRRWRPRHPRR